MRRIIKKIAKLKLIYQKFFFGLERVALYELTSDTLRKGFNFFIIFIVLTAYLYVPISILPIPDLLKDKLAKLQPEIKKAHAAVAFADASSIAASTGDDVTVTLPAHSANDIFLLQVVVADTDDTITVSGWTSLGTVTDGTAAKNFWFWLRASSSSETNPLVDKSTVTGDTFATVTRFTGAYTTSDPWEVKGTPACTGTTNPSTYTGVTTLTDGALVVFSGNDYDNFFASATYSATDPTSLTSNVVNQSPMGNDGSNILGSAVRATAGATGNIGVELNKAPDGLCGLVLGLKPEPVDETPPTLSNQTVGSITSQGGTPAVDTNEGNGTAYMVVVPDGDSPSVAQIKAGQNSSGGAALANQNQAVSGTGTQTFSAVTGLNDSTAYDVWFVHTDAASNDSTAVKADFTTTDGTAPTLSNQTVGSITTQGGTPQVDTDEGNGTAYMVVVPDGDSPSVAQIKAGQNSSGGAALADESKAVSATGTITFTAVTGLSASTAYDVWFVHTDAASNDSTAVKADFTTSSASPPTEFVSIVDPGSGSGYDYATLSVWESSTQTDLTAATTQVFSGTLTGSLANDSTVYLCRGSSYQSHSATVVHANAAGAQILLESISGSATEQASDFWNDSSATCGSPTNYFTLSGDDAGGNSAIAVASVRSSDGSADTTAVTIDGWTTSASNYIKIWTDPATGARHNGKWDDGKYRLETTSTSSASLTINEDYVNVVGLQIYKNTTTATGDYTAVWAQGEDGGSIRNIHHQISENIIKGNTGYSTSSGWNGAIGDWSTLGKSGWLKIYNNVIYDIVNSGSSQGNCLRSGPGASSPDYYTYYYNNTFQNCKRAMMRNSQSQTIIAKNNIFKSMPDVATGYTYEAGTGYNSTDNSTMGYTVTGGATGDRVSQTFSFVDETNNDFHLASTDTAAKDVGTNLQSDSDLPISRDIDGLYRGAAFDIGADEAATEFVSSVMQSAGDYSTLSSWEDNVESDLTASTTRVFSGSLTGTLAENTLVELYRGGADQGIDGYVVAKSTVNGQILIDGITGSGTPVNAQANDQWRVSGGTANMWTVTGSGDALGASPIAVAKIDGAWASADSTAVEINGWTTSHDNYIKIYTTSAARHSGKWDDTKYRMVTTDQINAPLNLSEAYVFVDGLQLYKNITSQTDSIPTLWLYGDTASYQANYQVSNSIFRGNTSFNDGDTTSGIYDWATFSKTGYLKAWNNIFYDFLNATGSARAIWISPGQTSPDWHVYAYNNTIQNSKGGLFNVGGLQQSFVAKNNIVKGSGDTNAYDGTFSSGTDYNATDGTDNIGTGSNNKISQTFAFVDEDGDDFHLARTDTAAKNAGADLSSDADLAFSTDIDGQSRAGAGSGWDIGADEERSYSVNIKTNVNFKPGARLLRPGPWVCGDNLVDSRDSKSYATVQIGSQCWMKQGLNIGTRIAGGTAQGTTCVSAADIEKWCYSNTDANCDSSNNPNYPDGGLYQWNQAMCGAATCNGTGESQPACSTPVQGICPTGWHLPSHYEYTALERAVCDSGSCATDFPYDTTTTGYRGTDEGTKLKPNGSSGWEGNLSGNYNSGFSNRATAGYFWSSTEFDASLALSRLLDSGAATVYRGFGGKGSRGFSVRCVKD